MTVPSSQEPQSPSRPSSISGGVFSVSPCPQGQGDTVRSTSLVTTCQSTKKQLIPWSRKQKRHFHTLMSVLKRWEHRGMEIKWVTLTSARGGSDLRKHLRELERRVMRDHGTGNLEHAVVDTTEGFGVLHILWAHPRRCYIPQAWLSEQWADIHGAIIVHIRRYENGTRKRLSRYMVSQYMSGQSGAGVRISWSWKTTFTIPIKRAWRVFKRCYAYGSRYSLIEAWGRFLCGETVFLGGYFLSLRTWGAVWGLMQYERHGGVAYGV